MTNNNWYDVHWMSARITNNEQKHAHNKIVEIILKKAQILDIIGKWDKEIELLHKGIALGNNDAQLQISRLKLELGQAYQLQGNYPKAFEILHQLENTFKNNHDPKSKDFYGKVVMNLGIVHVNKGRMIKPWHALKRVWLP